MIDDWPALNGLGVLIVDDSVEIASLVSDIFSENGARTSVAHTGQGAISLLEEGKYDLLILDLIMPEPNGWRVLQFLRDTAPEMLERTIVLTALRYDRRTGESLQGWNVTHLFKPFRINELLQAVDGVLASADHTCHLT